jgi:hypothetical protein
MLPEEYLNTAVLEELSFLYDYTMACGDAEAYTCNTRSTMMTTTVSLHSIQITCCVGATMQDLKRILTQLH